MPDPVELLLEDLAQRYAHEEVSDAFLQLYKGDAEFGRVFASLHERLNRHFEAINGRARTTHHYWADDSREMIALIDELGETLYQVKNAGFQVVFASDYQLAIDRCRPWLSPSGGSSVPDEFAPIRLIKYQPIFSRPETTIRLDKKQAALDLKMIGQGAYASVYSYVDPDYGIKFAVKRAKKDLSERDLHRFKQEFDVLKRLSFPYIVEVYTFDNVRNEYRMEFCDETLRTYIRKRNGNLSFAARKRIALQFLYGINYIHSQRLLHRDVSLQNVLVKVFGSGAVLVKLSDFGLVKDVDSEFTRTQTEMRGTIRDPSLTSFKDYGILNEMYALGWVLSYIFTGKESLKFGSDTVSAIIQKCTSSDPTARYATVLDLIGAVEQLDARPTDVIA